LSPQRRYAVSPAWLALSRQERNALVAAHVRPLFASYADRVRARFFDAEAFQVRDTDFALLETEDLSAYYFLIEELGDTPLISRQYLAFTDIKIGIEDGYREFEQATGHDTTQAARP
jgi:chlorite dismutase